MKKNAFTLVELLAVIVILAIILVISIPKISNTISESKTRLYNQTIKEIEKVAQQYVVENIDSLNSDNFTINISTLCNENYIDCPITDPRDNTEITGVVSVNYVNGNYTYTYNENA